MTLKNPLRTEIQSIIDRLVENLLEVIQEYKAKEGAKVLPFRCPPSTGVLGPVQKLPSRVTGNTKRVLVELTSKGFSARLPDGRAWNRKRERDLLLKLKQAGFEPYSFNR